MTRKRYVLDAAGTTWLTRGGSVAPPPPPEPTRDVLLQAHPSDDLFNLPMHNNATFASASDPRVTAWRTTPVTYYTAYGVNGPEANSHTIAYATLSDPLVAVADRTDASRSATFRLPVGALAAPGNDQHLHVVQPDGFTVYEMFSFHRTLSGWTGSNPSAHRIEVVDLRARSTGPGNGTRAFGGPATAGLIRQWEIDPTHPDYTDGVIRHKIAWACWPQQMWVNKAGYDTLPNASGSGGYGAHGYYGSGTVTSGNAALFPGKPLGLSIAGYMMQPGYTGEATEQDYFSVVAGTDSDFQWYRKRATVCDGVQMGSEWAIPPSVNLAAQGFTPAGLTLATAFQDWGGVVTDTAGFSCPFVEVPQTRPITVPTFVTQLRSNNSADIRKIIDLALLVTNHDWDNPGGGPRASTNRRRPLLPDLAT